MNNLKSGEFLECSCTLCNFRGHKEDFLEHLVSIDRAETTIMQYRAALHILWCWNLDYNKNKSNCDK